jgi:hypothetical protein
MDEKNSKRSKVLFSITIGALLIAMPLLFYTLLMCFDRNYTGILYSEWQQVSLSDVGTIYIPEDWSFVKSDDDLIDAVIYGPTTKNGGEDSRQIYFICYKLKDYEKAIQQKTVFENLDEVLSESNLIKEGFDLGVFWSVLENKNKETGEQNRYHELYIARNDFYVILSTADSVSAGMMLRIVISFSAY